MNKTPISVTILTKNSQKYLQEVLTALQAFDEILIWDTGSTDQTLAIAQKFSNVILQKSEFIGFGPTHNQASQWAKHDWILSIDSDEVVTPALAQEILQLSLNPSCVYSFPRHNEYREKWIKGCGWHPDRQVRLYHRQQTQFSDVQVHETVIKTHLREIQLKSPLRHYSYASVDDFLTKMHIYSSLFAKQYAGKKSASFFKAINHGLFAFVKSYFIKQGIFLGQEGFEISWYNANTAFYKYLKLAEANRQLHVMSEPLETSDDDQKKMPVLSID